MARGARSAGRVRPRIRLRRCFGPRVCVGGRAAPSPVILPRGKKHATNAVEPLRGRAIIWTGGGIAGGADRAGDLEGPPTCRTLELVAWHGRCSHPAPRRFSGAAARDSAPLAQLRRLHATWVPLGTSSRASKPRVRRSQSRGGNVHRRRRSRPEDHPAGGEAQLATAPQVRWRLSPLAPTRRPTQPPMVKTVRATSPFFIATNASLMSSRPPVREIISSSLSRPWR